MGLLRSWQDSDPKPACLRWSSPLALTALDRLFTFEWSIRKLAGRADTRGPPTRDSPSPRLAGSRAARRVALLLNHGSLTLIR